MVRIVKDYWKNVENHEDLIKRCFYHLWKKFPNPDGFNDSYNYLLSKMACIRKATESGKPLTTNIFKKFKASMHDKEIVDKRFEQFMYMWIHHFLEEYYLKRRLHANRFKAGDLSGEFNIGTVKQWQRNHQMDKWEDEKPHGAKDPRKINRKGKYFPTIDDISEFVTEPEENPVETMIAQETSEEIRGHLESDKVKKVYDLLIEGIPPKDIASTLGCTRSYASAIIGKIRDTYRQMHPQCAF